MLDVDGLPVQVSASASRTLNLRVKPDGSVQASAPLLVDDAFVKAFVRQKRPWIDAQPRRLRRLADGESRCGGDPRRWRQWRAVVEACVPALVERGSRSWA